MNNFRVNYSKLAIKLGVGVADGQNLDTIAEEIKKILSKRKCWLLIIDNYNSTECEGFERGTASHYIASSPGSFSAFQFCMLKNYIEKLGMGLGTRLQSLCMKKCAQNLGGGAS